MRRRTAGLALAAMVLLAGCFPQPVREIDRFHLLQARGTPPPARATRSYALIVSSSASVFYETRAMAFSREPGTRAYYQYNRWTEPPSQQLGAQLIAWLEASRAFETVASARSAVTGELHLSVHFDDLYHDAAEPPGRSLIAVSAELTDPVRRKLLGRRTFTSAAPAPTHDANGAVAAFGQAAGALFADLVAWVDQTAPR